MSKPQVIIGSSVYITGATGHLLSALKNELQVENPDKIKARMQKRYHAHLPTFLPVYELLGNGTMKVMRGYREEAIQILKDYSDDVEVVDKRTNGKSADLPWNIDKFKPRDYQIEAVSNILDKQNGIIHFATSAGKTVTGLYAIHKIGKVSVWLAHTMDLVKQAYNNAQMAYTEDGEVSASGIQLLGAGKDTFNSRTCTVLFASIQTLVNRPKILYWLWQNAGVVLVDEAHRAAGPTYQQVLGGFNCKHVLGVTATPQRQDQKEFLVKGSIGDIIASKERDDLVDDRRILTPKIDLIYTNFIGKIGQDLQGAAAGKVFREKKTQLYADEDRLDLIIENVQKTHDTMNNITLLVADSKEYAHKIFWKLKEKKYNVRYVHGGISLPLRGHLWEQLRERKVEMVVATSQLVKEGLDITTLDTLHLCTPFGGDSAGRSDGGMLEQMIGRIQRPDPDNDLKIPRVYDYVDYEDTMLHNQYSKRRKVYNRLGMKLPRKKAKSLIEKIEDIQF